MCVVGCAFFFSGAAGARRVIRIRTLCFVSPSVAGGEGQRACAGASFVIASVSPLSAFFFYSPRSRFTPDESRRAA